MYAGLPPTAPPATTDQNGSSSASASSAPATVARPVPPVVLDPRMIPPTDDMSPRSAKRPRTDGGAAQLSPRSARATAAGTGGLAAPTNPDVARVKAILAAKAAKARAATRAPARMGSPWVGTPWIGGKSPWTSRAADAAGQAAPNETEVSGVDTHGSMMDSMMAGTAAEPAVTKTILLKKKKAGFGVNVSNNAEVLSFNQEPDGSPGPAQEAGVVKMSRILEVNGVRVKNKLELLEQLKKLKASGAPPAALSQCKPWTRPNTSTPIV